MADKTLTHEEKEQLLATLKKRFEKNMGRHETLNFEDIEKKLNQYPEKLWALNEMEKTEGEPDVIGVEKKQYIFVDCSKESPKGRRSVCYDRAALEARKKYKPETSAMDMAQEMGIEILDEAQYRNLQQIGHFDQKTSSWIQTPDHIRELGGALFCDYRYDTVFVYHNGADSYYASRGFRGVLRV